MVCDLVASRPSVLLCFCFLFLLILFGVSIFCFGCLGWSRFTPTRYRMIVRCKTAYYTFYLPCAIGMIYAGVKDPASYRLARDICCRIGEFFQIQDDFLDCFGDPKVIGKVLECKKKRGAREKIERKGGRDERRKCEGISGVSE